MTTETEQNRNFYPAFRIFVFGVEVTEDVLSCKVVFNDARAPSTAEFVLTSPEDRYIVDATDIHALYPVVPNLADVVLPAVKRALELRPVDENGQFVNGTANQEFNEATESTANEVTRIAQDRIRREINDEVKRRVLNEKIKHLVQVAQPDISKTGEQKITAETLQQLRGKAYRYPFQVGDCVFHSNDAVRIFWRDPRDPTAWYHMFTGFVSDWTDDVDENNTRTVIVRCEDVLRILRYARVTTNPGIFDISAIQQVEDGVIRTFFGDVGFTGLSLQELLFTILFGSDLSGTTSLLRSTGGTSFAGIKSNYQRISVNGSAESQISNDAVGSFSLERSTIFLFGSEAAQGAAKAETGPNLPGLPEEIERRQVILQSNGLSVYQAIVDHQVYPSDLTTMKTFGGTGVAVEESEGIEGVITAIGKNPHLYPVDGGRLLMLLPRSLGPTVRREILLKDLVQGVALSTTFRSRMDLIFDVMARLEFSFYASPRGDLIAEMPLYDFDPDDFGTVPVTRESFRSALSGNAATVAALTDLISIEEARGPFAPHYHVAKRDTIRWQRSFSDEKVRTAFSTYWQNIRGLSSTQTSEQLGFKPEVVILRSLVPQFGVRLEKVEPHVLITDPAQAQIYAQLKCNMWNADARSSQVEAIPQLRIMPNRPLLFTERQYIATVRSVDHSLVWSSDMSMSMGVNYIRGWNGQFQDDGKTPVYTPMGGYASRPLNYAQLFGVRSAKQSTATPDDT